MLKTFALEVVDDVVGALLNRLPKDGALVADELRSGFELLALDVAAPVVAGVVEN